VARDRHVAAISVDYNRSRRYADKIAVEARSRVMRFGFHLFMVDPAQHLEIARTADEAGWDSLQVAEASSGTMVR
jgi:hypothetical protein